MCIAVPEAQGPLSSGPTRYLGKMLFLEQIHAIFCFPGKCLPLSLLASLPHLLLLN